jgi:hypothetical protein
MKTTRNITILGIEPEIKKSDKKPCNKSNGGSYPYQLHYRITDGEDGFDCEPNPFDQSYNEIRFRKFGTEEWIYAEIKTEHN